MTVQGLQCYNVYTFNDFPGETIPLSVTTVSSSVSFFLPASANCRDMMITNAGPNTVFFQAGLKSAGAITAQVPATNGTTGATPLLSGAIYNFQKQSDNQKADTIAAITSTGAATIYITAVQGS